MNGLGKETGEEAAKEEMMMKEMTPPPALLLEAPSPSSSVGVAVKKAAIVDALPYIDDEYGNPSVKADVDRLVEEELRRSVKSPAHFLLDLPKLPTSKFPVLLHTFFFFLFLLFALLYLHFYFYFYFHYHRGRKKNNKKKKE